MVIRTECLQEPAKERRVPRELWFWRGCSVQVKQPRKEEENREDLEEGGRGAVHLRAQENGAGR